MREKKEILLIDMDGVLVDFEREMRDRFEKNPNLKKVYSESPDLLPHIFRTAKPVKGAIEAVRKLHESGKYEMLIATTASWDNEDAGTDKRIWIEEYFGDLFRKKMFITHRKDLLCGDYLIDDRKANGAKDFKGELLSFGWAYEENKWNEYPTWDDILTKLL